MVRAAVAADLADVVRLELATAEAPHWTEGEYAAILDRCGEDISNAKLSGETTLRRCFFVAELEGRLAGFAVGKVVGMGVASVAELESVAVDHAARRMGAGRALCRAVVAWSAGMGARELELEVRGGSAGAIALYRGLGFAVVGHRAGYYHDPEEEALLMRLDLVRAE